ncbi:MAG: uracil-DNA glycosylase [Chloracidobacterium sp.]|nr:uracil-DNA glycosylase [Chloracidobacterium sp.]MDW8218206.1 uracil-DNA glycosylase [Acidobacteriota bacterium]
MKTATNGSQPSNLPDIPDSNQLAQLRQAITTCRLCPRLTAWREDVARHKVRRFQSEAYWGKPVPGFGDPQAQVLVVGLAPAAHGGNRTGRLFTGDRSGDWLFRALHRAGFANQPTSTHQNDGLTLTNCYITAAVRCAPPGNRPTPEEATACLPFLVREMRLLPQVRVIVALGGFAFEYTLKALRQQGVAIPKPKPKFSHGARYALTDGVTLFGAYHPSQQNTLTGKLTEAMLDAVFAAVRRTLDELISHPAL